MTGTEMKRSGNIAVVFALRHPLLTATTIVMIGRRRAIAECTAMVEIDYDLRYCIFDENFRENNMVISKGTAIPAPQRRAAATEIEYLSRKEPGKCKSIGLVIVAKLYLLLYYYVFQ